MINCSQRKLKSTVILVATSHNNIHYRNTIMPCSFVLAAIHTGIASGETKSGNGCFPHARVESGDRDSFATDTAAT